MIKCEFELNGGLFLDDGRPIGEIIAEVLRARFNKRDRAHVVRDRRCIDRVLNSQMGHIGKHHRRQWRSVSETLAIPRVVYLIITTAGRRAMLVSRYSPPPPGHSE